jgi:hypothetical protein
MEPLTREERIKNYAYTWWELKGKRHGHDVEDYLKAEHIVDGEDKVALREKQNEYIQQHSKAKCSTT